MLYQECMNNLQTEDEKELPSEEEALQIAIQRRLTRIESPLYQNQQIELLAATLRPSLPSVAEQYTQLYTKLEVFSNSFKYDNGPLFNWSYIQYLSLKFRRNTKKNKYLISWKGSNT